MGRYRGMWAALLLSCLLGAATAAAGEPAEALVAIFAEAAFPYYVASPAVSPEFVRDCLARAGVGSRLLNARELADPAAFSAQRYRVLVHVYGNTFPVAALENLRRFHSERGGIVALGGVPFCHPCVKEEGKWVDRIDSLGWEFVSHRAMGTGLWADTRDAEALRHAPDDPLGIAWMPLPAPPPGVLQALRVDMTLADSREMGHDYMVGTPPEDHVIPVVSAIKGGRPAVHPFAVIEHGCPEFAGAVDAWAGASLGPSFSLQQQEQIIVATCAYLLQRAGVLPAERRREMLAGTRARYVAPLTEVPARTRPFIPRSRPPARRLVVLDAMGLTSEERILALSLQGIVNRKEPRVYVLAEFKDQAWLDLLRKEGCRPQPCRSLAELVRRFRGEVAGAILTDPAQPHSVNVATTLAGVENAVVATPALAERLGLKTVTDLRGRFKTPMEGYEWLLAGVWPRLEHRAIACMHPRWDAPRDYLVQHRVLTFWMDWDVNQPQPSGEALFLERLLGRMPPHGMVLGWWQEGDSGGIGEWRGVTTASQYSKITVCTVGAWNLSVHSGARMPDLLKQKPVRAGSLDRKAYVAFVVSDGDNFGMNLYSVIARFWSQEMRGKVPIGWGICPTQVELTPGIVRHFYETATDNDLFVCMDGLGYVYPDQYGTALGDAKAYYGEFLKQTAPYMAQLDQRHLWFLAGTGRAGQMAQVLRPDGLFGEYGVFPEQRQELIGETAALWADVNPWDKGYEKAGWYVEQIRKRTPAGRPAFLFVGVNGFCIGPNEVAQILRELGPGYVAVRPDELCALYRRYRTAGVDASPAPRRPLDLSAAPAAGPQRARGRVTLVREDDGDPDIGGWHTDPKGTAWVRKRLQVRLPASANQATVRLMVRGQKGARVTIRLNGREHRVPLRTSGWEWLSLKVPAAELRDGQNEISYTCNPDARLHTAGDGRGSLGHSDYGGPEQWSPLAGELMCYLEIR